MLRRRAIGLAGELEVDATRGAEYTQCNIFNQAGRASAFGSTPRAGRPLHPAVLSIPRPAQIRPPPPGKGPYAEPADAPRRPQSHADLLSARACTCGARACICFRRTYLGLKLAHSGGKGPFS